MAVQIGLGISLAIGITAFEWRTEAKKVGVRINEDSAFQLIPEIPSTGLKEPHPPSPIKSEMIPTRAFLPTTLVMTSNDDQSSSTDSTPILDSSLPSVNYTVPAEDPEDCESCFFYIVEKNAEPTGGYEVFYKNLRENLKYPWKAKQYNVEGKVYVEFIVDRMGTPMDLKIIRGIGFGCDEEAIRVIALSKWNPGKQRGRAVRVKMVMPIVFQLN